ncbi:MAG: ABC transporter transmembrane domain-containing protein [Burkholderiales bacterium]|nr:ABC transporter transmembrane domain-containing protein [Burkholderiales bacterium]
MSKNSVKISSIRHWLKDYQVIRQYRLQWILAIGFVFVAAGATLAVPIAFRQLIDTGLTSQEIHREFIYLLVIALVLALGTALRFYFMSWLGERVVADMRERVFKNVLRQSPSYFETLQSGEVLSRLTSDTTLIQTLVGTSISLALRSAVMAIGGIGMMLATSPWLAGMMVGLLLFTVLPLWAFGRRVRKMSRASQDKVADASAIAGEILSAMPTVQAFVREPYEQKRYRAAVELAFAVAKERIKVRSMLTALAITLAFSVIVFVLWVGALQVGSGQITIGQLTQFVLYAALVSGSIGALSEVWGDLQRASGATERLVELIQAKPAIAFDHHGIDDSANRLKQQMEVIGALADTQTEAIQFADVSFSYPSRPTFLALDHLNLTIPKGQSYALVGPSGAGKSTIFSLLLRFYEPQNGTITIFGRALEQWPIDELRHLIAIVPQEPLIFANSALENIRYGRLNATDDEVIAAAKMAYADEFISALPEGYHSFLGERGVRLSGGQKQRISIARAILKNPFILLLDEATASLDAESERAVQKALNALLPGKTALIIAHRLATVLRADRIIVIDEGRIVEQGTHIELLEKNGLYARLAKLQFTA